MDIQSSAYGFIAKIYIVFLLITAAFIPQLLFTKNIALIFLLFIFLLFSKTIIKNIDYLDLLLFVFIVMVTLGLAYSQDIGAAFKRYLETYLPLALIYIISKNLRKDSYVFLTRAIVFLGALASVFIIFEFFTGRNFIYEHVLQNKYFNSAFYKGRAFGTFYHPTIAGSFLTMCLPFAWIYLHDKRNRVNLISGSIIFIAISVAIAATLSKMAMIVMLFIYLWCARQRGRHIDKLLLITFFILTAVIFLKTAVFTDKFSPSFSVIAVTYRLKSLLAAIRMAREHPFVGVGLDHFKLLYLNYANNLNVKYDLRIPDNMYLTILAETGVITFISFGVFIYALVKKALMALKKMRDSSEKILLSAALVSFIGALIHNLSYDSFYWSAPLIVFWMLAGMITSCSKKEEQDEHLLFT